MKDRIRAALKRLKGRAKEYMTSILFGMGSMLFPLAVYLLVDGRPDDAWFAKTMGIMGMLSIMTAVVFQQIEERRDRKFKRVLLGYVNTKVTNVETLLMQIRDRGKVDNDTDNNTKPTDTSPKK